MHLVWRFSAINVFSLDCFTEHREYTLEDLGSTLEISSIYVRENRSTSYNLVLVESFKEILR